MELPLAPSSRFSFPIAQSLQQQAHSLLLSRSLGADRLEGTPEKVPDDEPKHIDMDESKWHTSLKRANLDHDHVCIQQKHMYMVNA